jgi:hypothetical protein
MRLACQLDVGSSCTLQEQDQVGPGLAVLSPSLALAPAGRCAHSATMPLAGAAALGLVN